MLFEAIYTEIADFRKVSDFSLEGEDHALLEELAILTLEEYSLAFPSPEQWEDMKENDQFVYNNIYKAIIYEMKYIAENPEHFTEHADLKSGYSVGRISVNGGSKISNIDRERIKLSPIAKTYIDRSGIVVVDLCTTNYNPCNPCGCVGGLF